jgi:hypothetical protein
MKRRNWIAAAAAAGVAATVALALNGPAGAAPAAPTAPTVVAKPIPAAAELSAQQLDATVTGRELDRWAAANPALAAQTGRVTIPVWVKVFYDRQTGAGKLTNAQALAQVQWLNHSFAGGQSSAAANTRFRFEYRGYNNIAVDSRSVDITPATGNGADWPARTQTLMRQHHNGGVGTLNIYVADINALGAASTPRFAGAHPNIDGVWVDRSAWRGVAAGADAYDQGDTAVHEVGHWLSLGHGDTSGACVANFMSYAPDPCMNRFTGTQATRMSNAWTRYRG